MVEYASLICMLGVRMSDFKLQVAVPYAYGQPSVFAA